MRILYVLTDAKIGGAETLVETLALRKHPEDTVGLVVLLGRDQLSERLDEAFDNVYYLDFPENSRNLIKMVRRLESVIKRFRPDLIHSNLFHADLVTMLARSGRIPKVTTIHTQGFGPRDHPLTKAIAKVVGLGSFRFKMGIPTPGSAAFARRLGFRRLAEPIANSANIPDSAVFNPRARAFGSIARFHPVKGHSVLFRAFREVLTDYPEWRLVCTGPGVDAGNSELLTLVEDAGLGEALVNGSLVLNGSTNDVGQVLKDTSVLLISSLYGETFPMVGVEANGAGIPVITTDVGESRVFAFDDSYVVTPNDEVALAAAMKRYAGLSLADRERMSIAVRDRAVTEFDPGKLVARYRAVYQTVLANGST